MKTIKLRLCPHCVAQLVTALDEAFLKANPDHEQVKSPAVAFSESHQKWVDNGREP